MFDTQEQLCQFIHYDPDTGVFTRVGSRYRTDKIGQRADYTHGKYRRVAIDGERYYAHQVAWFYMTGKWEDMLDHEDGDGHNNKIKNLRPANEMLNMCNSRLKSNNTSGYKGVSRTANGKWVAQITFNKVTTHLGIFERIEDAAEARRKAAEQLHGEYVRHK